jgi:membrane protease YdiL (CAAX protease family)
MRRDAEDRNSSVWHRLAPWTFPVVYLGWAYLFWGIVVGSGASVWSFPNVVFLVVGGASPLLAGVGLTWLTRGRAGLADLWRRLVDVRRISPRWWVGLLLFYPVFNLTLAGLAVLAGVTADPLEVISPVRLFDPLGLFGLLAFSLLLPLPEEVGLRGYWLDRLQERWSALVASLVLGVTWAAWHVPLLFMEGYYSSTTFQPEPLPFLGSIAFGAVLVTWVYNNTGRSVLAAVLFHFAGNFTGEVAGLAPDLYGYSFVATALVAGAVTAWWGADTLSRDGRQTSGSETRSGP